MLNSRTGASLLGGEESVVVVITQLIAKETQGLVLFCESLTYRRTYRWMGVERTEMLTHPKGRFCNRAITKWNVTTKTWAPLGWKIQCSCILELLKTCSIQRWRTFSYALFNIFLQTNSIGRGHKRSAFVFRCKLSYVGDDTAGMSLPADKGPKVAWHTQNETPDNAEPRLLLITDQCFSLTDQGCFQGTILIRRGKCKQQYKCSHIKMKLP